MALSGPEGVVIKTSAVTQSGKVTSSKKGVRCVAGPLEPHDRDALIYLLIRHV